MKELIRKILKEQVKRKKYAIRDLRNDDAYARIFWAMISELHQTTNDFNKRKLFESIYVVFQRWTDRPPVYVSRKVADLFIENKPNIDPFHLMHGERYTLGRSSTKGSLLVWEHTTPIAGFLRQFIQCNSYNEVLEKMNSYTGVCWVTRDEDSCLYRNKFHSKRPEGWRAAYSSCDIEPLTKSEYELYKNQKLNSTEDEII